MWADFFLLWYIFYSWIARFIAHLDLELLQIDVKTSYHNGELNEEINIEQHTGLK